MEKVTDGDLAIVVAGPAGSFGNNVYVVIDRQSGEAAFIDAPDEAEKSIAAAEFGGVRPTRILLTHSHGDHTASIDRLKDVYGCKLYADAREPWLKEGQLDEPVNDGDEIRIGSLTLSAVSVPGHTPGSTTYLWGRHAFVGDTLFPGGPGRTHSNEMLRQELDSITNRLYTLPDDTIIYPGHGGQTTIGASKEEYAGFAAREQDPDLHGDVLWAGS